MTPLHVDVIILILVSVLTWVASLITGDTSWVDRIWSIVPAAYVWVFAALVSPSNVRLNVMAALVTVWGVRLTFNLARKGGYSGVEDYRWPVLRSRMKKWQFQLFNLFFIVIYQNVLLFLMALPALTAYDHPTTSFGILDAVLTVAFLACTLGETLADQQQWNFQASKRARARVGNSPSPQFLQSGLFRFSRHPNYFFELAQWWIFFLLGTVAAGSLFQWSAIGAILLTGLFVGSTKFTEEITLSHYPDYADYQRRTSALVPWFPSRMTELTGVGELNDQV